MNDHPFLNGDSEPDRDFRELDLIGLRSRLGGRTTNTALESTKQPQQLASKGLTWYEFLFYVVLLVGFWIAGQLTVGIPDELGADILVLAFALFRQRMLNNRN
jgi:hypothetical protein